MSFISKRIFCYILCYIVGLGIFSGPLYAQDIYLVRHFEKAAATAITDTKGPELTSQGQEKAELLARFLIDKNIQSIYSTDYKRTIQTAAPSASTLAVEISFYNPRKLSEFAASLMETAASKPLIDSRKPSILIVGHSNTTPELLALFGGPTLALSEKDYGDVFIINTNTKHFRHVFIQ